MESHLIYYGGKSVYGYTTNQKFVWYINVTIILIICIINKLSCLWVLIKLNTEVFDTEIVIFNPLIVLDIGHSLLFSNVNNFFVKYSCLNLFWYVYHKLPPQFLFPHKQPLSFFVCSFTNKFNFFLNSRPNTPVFW